MIRDTFQLKLPFDPVIIMNSLNILYNSKQSLTELQIREADDLCETHVRHQQTC